MKNKFSVGERVSIQYVNGSIGEETGKIRRVYKFDIADINTGEEVTKYLYFIHWDDAMMNVYSEEEVKSNFGIPDPYLNFQLWQEDRIVFRGPTLDDQYWNIMQGFTSE
jgi:hypothetical protein